MPDRDDSIVKATNDPSAGALAAALRALPDAAPQPDLWPQLAQSLQARRRRRPRWQPFALAAGIGALALLAAGHWLPGTRSSTPSGTPTTTRVEATPPATRSDELDRLHARSRSLEDWIAAIPDRAPQSGRDLMAAVEIEDLIGLVDMQLDASRDGDDTVPLWRQRVALLEDLAVVRSVPVALNLSTASAEPAGTLF